MNEPGGSFLPEKAKEQTQPYEIKREAEQHHTAQPITSLRVPAPTGQNHPKFRKRCSRRFASTQPPPPLKDPCLCGSAA